jgi:hypothetical protein
VAVVSEFLRAVGEEFGPDALPKSTPLKTNPVTGAFSVSGLDQFRRSFRERLRRLSHLYPDSNDNRNVLIALLLQLVKPTGWQGAYSELAAFDFLHQPDLTDTPGSLGRADLHVRLTGEHTLCGYYGKPQTEVDAHFLRSDFYVEVKCLKDGSREILEGVVREGLPEDARRGLLVGIGYQHDEPPEKLASCRNRMAASLKSQYPGTEMKKQASFRLARGVGVSIAPRPGILCTEEPFNERRYACHFPKLVWSDARQFVTDRPFLLTYVIFPWYNQLIHGIADWSKEFCRMAARRVSCQHFRHPERFSDLDPGFSGTQTADSVMRKISGILFLEDQSISGANPEYGHTTAMLFINPNADNPFNGLLLSVLERGLDNAIKVEDFQDDNY